MDTHRADGDWQPRCGGVLVLNRGDRAVDIILQRLDILRDVHLGAADEKVNVHEVVFAPGAEAEEGVEVSQAPRASGIGDSGGAELDGAVVRLQVSLEDRDTLGGGKIRLRRVIRFVGPV